MTIKEIECNCTRSRSVFLVMFLKLKAVKYKKYLNNTGGIEYCCL